MLSICVGKCLGEKEPRVPVSHKYVKQKWWRRSTRPLTCKCKGEEVFATTVFFKSVLRLKLLAWSELFLSHPAGCWYLESVDPNENPNDKDEKVIFRKWRGDLLMALIDR